MSLALFAAVLLSAAPAPNPDRPAVRAKQALDQTADVVLEGKTLNELVGWFRGRTGLDVQLDPVAVAAAGLDPDAPAFTVKHRGTTYRQGLRAALAPHDLRAGLVGSTLVISSDDGLTARQMRQRTTLSGGPLAKVLSDLAGETGANVVLDPRVRAKAAEAAVELSLDDVPLETAVRLAAEVAGYRAVRLGNVLFVTTDERADKLRPDADGPTPPLYPAGPVPGLAGGAGKDK